MGAKTAYEILTDPSPTAREKLILWLAQRCIRRVSKPQQPKIEDAWWIIAVCMRWGAITREECPNMSRKSLGKLAEDILSTWQLMKMENIE